MFWLGFLSGIIVSAFIGALVVKYWLYLKKRFGSVQWYEVSDVSYKQEKDGIYLMRFYFNGDEYQGYTKKMPPFGIPVNDLEVKIRGLHPKRGIYRVFWRMKDIA